MSGLVMIGPAVWAVGEYIYIGYDLDLEKWCAPSLGGDHHHARFGHDRSSGVGCKRVYIYIYT